MVKDSLPEYRKRGNDASVKHKTDYDRAVKINRAFILIYIDISLQGVLCMDGCVHLFEQFARSVLQSFAH